MKNPNYTSTPNPSYQVTDENGNEKTIWNSRSCAVTMISAFYNREEDDFYIALGERGPAAPDENGKLCIPCGYVDWDETASQSGYRETWEEIGLPLEAIVNQQELVGYLIIAIDDQPWYVSHAPKADGKQNITLHFANVVEWEGELPELTTEYNEVEGEVVNPRWYSYKEIREMGAEKFAFNHDGIIGNFMYTLMAYMQVYEQQRS